jgi:hypothetical protein
MQVSCVPIDQGMKYTFYFDNSYQQDHGFKKIDSCAFHCLFDLLMEKKVNWLESNHIYSMHNA